MQIPDIDRPVRVGVFAKVQNAEKAVSDLLAAGFTREQITVICSNKHKEALFGDLADQVQGTRETPEAIVTGGVVGATLGGMALAVTAVMTGGASILAAGAVLIGGGAIAGSFTGAMMTRGFQKEAADYYDSAVQLGKILVGVEILGEGTEARRAEAERILTNAGAEPVALSQG